MKLKRLQTGMISQLKDLKLCSLIKHKIPFKTLRDGEIIII